MKVNVLECLLQKPTEWLQKEKRDEKVIKKEEEEMPNALLELQCFGYLFLFSILDAIKDNLFLD